MKKCAMGVHECEEYVKEDLLHLETDLCRVAHFCKAKSHMGSHFGMNKLLVCVLCVPLSIVLSPEFRFKINCFTVSSRVAFLVFVSSLPLCPFLHMGLPASPHDAADVTIQQ